MAAPRRARQQDGNAEQDQHEDAAAPVQGGGKDHARHGHVQRPGHEKRAVSDEAEDKLPEKDQRKQPPDHHARPRRGLPVRKPPRDPHGPEPGGDELKRPPARQETLQQERLRRDERQGSKKGDGSEEGRRPHRRRFPIAAVPRLRRAAQQEQRRDTGEQGHAEQDAGQPEPRLIHEQPELHELRRRPYPARRKQREQDEQDAPYPRVAPPDEHGEQGARHGKGGLTRPPEMGSADCKRQRRRDETGKRTQTTHGTLLPLRG